MPGGLSELSGPGNAYYDHCGRGKVKSHQLHRRQVRGLPVSVLRPDPGPLTCLFSWTLMTDMASAFLRIVNGEGKYKELLPLLHSP